MAVEHKLPINNDVHHPNYWYKRSYHSLKQSLEVEFKVKNPTYLYHTTFQCGHMHQIGSGHVDWGQISVSPTYPYLSYSNRFWVDDPKFDKVVGGSLIFEDLK